MELEWIDYFYWLIHFSIVEIVHFFSFVCLIEKLLLLSLYNKMMINYWPSSSSSHHYLHYHYYFFVCVYRCFMCIEMNGYCFTIWKILILIYTIIITLSTLNVFNIGHSIDLVIILPLHKSFLWWCWWWCHWHFYTAI